MSTRHVHVNAAGGATPASRRRGVRVAGTAVAPILGMLSACLSVWFLLAQAASPSSVWPPPPATVPSLGSPGAPPPPATVPSLGSPGAPPSPATVPSLGSAGAPPPPVTVPSLGSVGAPAAPATVPSLGSPGAPPPPASVPTYGRTTDRAQPPDVGSQ